MSQFDQLIADTTALTAKATAIQTAITALVAEVAKLKATPLQDISAQLTSIEEATAALATAAGSDPGAQGVSITGMDVSSGPAAGGTTVTLTGTGLSGVTGVTFGGAAAQSFSLQSDTSLTAVSPAGSGTVEVRVSGPGGTSAPAPSQFSYQ